MKNLIALFSVAILIYSCSGEVTPTKVEGSLSYFGEQIEISNPIGIDQLLAKMSTSDSLTNAEVKGEIVETCAVKGCWMTIKNSGGEDVRVRFKDYGFFVPTEGASGKTATFKGTAFKDEISVDMQKHYIDDADLSAEEKEKQKAEITQPKAVISFLAEGVAIEGLAASH